jgi:hypothetical protein
MSVVVLTWVRWFNPVSLIGDQRDAAVRNLKNSVGYVDKS